VRLPERFDYEETSDNFDGVAEWWPVVTCRSNECAWTYDASWNDFAEDGDVNWDELHPAHVAS
jgi:hypothetical protein